VDLVLQESDTTTDGDFTACAADDVVAPAGVVVASGIFATIDADAEADLTYKVGYRGNKRYVRVRAVYTGDHSTGTPIAMVAVQTKAHRAPVA
jgi:hypothetical protein